MILKVSQSITLILISFLFNFNTIFAQTFDLHQSSYLKLIDEIIPWLEAHATTVTAIGIISTIFIFLIDKYIEKRKALFESLKNNISYYNAIINEIRTLHFLLESSKKSKEGNYEIHNFIFPTEVYEKMSIDKIDPVSEFSRSAIIDFYTNVKARNRLYMHRMEVKHRFIRTTNDQGWKQFIEYFDKQIKDYEIIISKMILKINEIVDAEIEENGNVERFEQKFIIIRKWLIFENSIRKLINR